jgi:ligand-binding sensor domain-containing protein
MKKILAFLFVFTNVFNFPQQAGNWKIYTSMRNINGFVFSNNAIWGASTGGAFQFNPNDGTYKKFTKVEGMTGINITATTLDKSGNVWFGSSNGALDVLSVGSNQIGSIPDILNSDRSTKQINSLQSSGDTIIAATDFGITLIDPINKVLYDTFFKFDYLISNSKVNFAVKYDLIYAASDNGAIIQKSGSTNLSAPESWTVYSTINGLPSNNIHKIVKYSNSIITASDKGISKFNGLGFETYISQLNNLNITDLYVNNDTLYILDGDNNVYSFANQNLVKIYTFSSNVMNIKVDTHDGLLGSCSNGIVHFINNRLNYISPNGPFANLFSDLGVDNDGTLWVGSGTDKTGIGFYSLQNEYWTNYNVSSFPILPSNAYFRIYCAPDNITYIGSYGRGFVRIKNGSISIFSSAITGMLGIPEDPTYLVVTGFAQDSKNNLWFLNYGAADRKNLAVLTKDSSYYHFIVPATSTLDVKAQTNLVIDQYDTKWYISNDQYNHGLIYFNENNTFADPSDDKSAFVQNLNTTNVNSVVVDKRGDVWVGTSLGVNVITNTYTIATTQNPQLSISSVFTLRQQNINCILVDPLNQKWVGTNQGLFLVDQDGTNLLSVYNSKNSPLLSDIILNLAIDQNTGTIYVSTDVGIISLKTTSVKPVDSFSGLHVYPSPFKLKNDNKNLTIDGLIADTDIKILTISGKLVREFSSPGGRIAFWDGRNDGGSLVSSGIYIIVAYDKEGNSVASGKIAIIRQ